MSFRPRTSVFARVIVALVFVASLANIGCADEDGTEEIRTTNPWPWFGATGPFAPSWQAPSAFGCTISERVRVVRKADPSPGEASENVTVLGEDGRSCEAPGTQIDVIDDQTESGRLVLGDCTSGLRLGTVRQSSMAEIRVGSADACGAYASVRASALGKSAHVRTRLRLISISPAVLELVGGAIDESGGNYNVVTAP